MKISYNWLKEILELDLSPQEVAEALTGAGFPVEDISPLTESIEDIVVAELMEVVPHPNADRLSLTKVNDGKEIHDVVCGAQNIAVGDKVPFAPVGSVLPGNFKIKKAKIRGEVSLGMLCSAEELNLDIQAEDGILQLPKDSEPGQSLSACLGLDDMILDVELTANRGDLLSLRGLTAELAAVLGRPFLLEEPSQPEDQRYSFPVTIDTGACTRYTGRLIKGVSVQPSPLWLQLRLLACGMRPVNNIVDATNLVMLEWGQPLHAFDADKLPETEITVRQARAGEKITTLDDKERQLDTSMMLITSGDKPVAIAGVMGSLDSEVDENTTNILLESAEFDSVSTRVTAKALGLASEAGARYEKGVDPAVVLPASHRAAALIVQLAGGTVGSVNSAGSQRVSTWTVEVNLNKINGLLGADIPRETVIEILKNLNLDVQVNGENLTVGVTGRRPDLQIWQDIAEEVGRLYGLDKVPSTLPRGELTSGARKPHQSLEWMMREILSGCGLHEVVPYSFISPEMAANSLAEQGVEISNPLTRQRSVMRGSMLPSILETVAHNMAHGQQGVAIYELGNIYRPNPTGDLPHQVQRISGALAGALPGHWQQPGQNYDFYALKGVVEQLLLGLGIDARFERTSAEPFHPGRCAAVYVGETQLGHLGQVHPAIMGNWKLDTQVLFFDLDFQALVSVSQSIPDFSAPSKYPAIRRDLALETDVQVEAGNLMEIIAKTGGFLLENVDCFDVYSGSELGQDRKSLAFALTFRHPRRTLKDKEVQALMDKIITALEETGVQLRK